MDQAVSLGETKKGRGRRSDGRAQGRGQGRGRGWGWGAKPAFEHPEAKVGARRYYTRGAEEEA